jgi:hypothetical protein
MGKYVMAVQSRPKEGREDEYNAWYDSTHFREICDLPGVTGGRRFRSTPISLGGPGLAYLAIFEIETDDPGAVMLEMGKRSQDGTWQRCDALDAPATVLWIYQQYEGSA